VLIMGWGGDHTAWAFHLPVFSSRYSVIAFDSRGGRPRRRTRPTPSAGWPTTPWACAHISGLSMGGLIAPELVLAHPDRVRIKRTPVVSSIASA
jgi:3-oxoadipate enol-lactonase